MAREYVIVVDSCADLSKEVRDELGIKYARMGLIKNAGKENEEEIYASLDGDVFTHKELFGWLRDGMLIKTSLVSMDEYHTVFGNILKEGKDILYIACSSALSGSYNLSLMVKEELLEKYPEAKIVCVDSLCSCMGQGLMALDCHEMKLQGKTLEEVGAYLEENKLCYHQFGTVETLEYLRRAGRVKAAAAFFGNIFGVKPMIISDAKGQNFAVKKVKGRRTSLLETVKMAKENLTNVEEQTIYVVHADSIDDATFVKELIEKEMNPKSVVITPMGPIIGVSTGPGTIAVYGKGNKVEVVGE